MAMQRANTARRNEFTAGRAAARSAMRDLGHLPVAIAMLEDRSPDWPKGLVGSLSHCGRDCIAVVAHRAKVRSLGVDIELDTPLAADLVGEICSRRERNWINKQPAERQGNLAKLFFSAKECAYKCQYPLTRELIDFSAFEVTIDLENQSFKAIFTRDVGGFSRGTSFVGRFGKAAGLIVTAMEIKNN